MNEQDKIAATNRRHWEKMASEGCGFSQPWLDLDPSLIHAYARGQLPNPPEPLTEMYPESVLADVAGKDVLCLASGGGQQSVVFALSVKKKLF